MKSVLGKLIQQEFGKERYEIYTEKLENKESMDIFCDIYEELRSKSSEHLNHSLKKLLDSVQVSIGISKKFVYISFVYLVSLLLLVCFQIAWLVLIPAFCLATICYGYKLTEFLQNRFCDQDVRIVLIYKIALFHLLEENCLQKESSKV